MNKEFILYLLNLKFFKIWLDENHSEVKPVQWRLMFPLHRSGIVILLSSKRNWPFFLTEFFWDVLFKEPLSFYPPAFDLTPSPALDEVLILHLTQPLAVKHLVSDVCYLSGVFFVTCSNEILKAINRSPVCMIRQNLWCLNGFVFVLYFHLECYKICSPGLINRVNMSGHMNGILRGIPSRFRFSVVLVRRLSLPVYVNRYSLPSTRYLT